jgi:hypothetical protein
MTWRATSWTLSACPDCGGDLYRDVLDDDVLTCLQCARIFDASQSARIEGTGAATGNDNQALLKDLWDQRLTREARAALWSRLVVGSALERQEARKPTRLKRAPADRNQRAA